MNSLKVIFDYDTWQEIFSSIKKNKVRTIITVIGVLWGIFIYITLSVHQMVWITDLIRSLKILR